VRGRFSAIVPLAIASLGIVLLGRTIAVAQDVTEPALKAAFIYNFARFTTWPADAAPADSFVICVLNDTAVAEALQHAVAGRSLTERPVSVTSVAPSASKKTCRVLYMAGLPVNKVAEVVAELRESPVLTISNIDGFASAGGMTQFFFEHGQLRFRIALESAKRAGLHISSRLLIMARPQ
jgi:hypothetical protein